MNPARQTAKIQNYEIGTGRLLLLAGPCMAESLELCLTVGRSLKTVCAELDIDFVFKASFDKANRTSIDSERGPGQEKGLAWLAQVRDELGVPILTDIHTPQQAEPVAAVCDCLQIPAFLSRQTDLLVAAARTGKAVNVKKGQFMAPWEMDNVAQKIRACDNPNVLLTERGSFFGYNRLVNDMRSIPQMQRYAPTIFDATHSVQQPGGLGTITGGEREFAPLLAGAALAMGADGLFLETHPDPDNALSDAACQIALDDMPDVLKRCKGIHNVVHTQ
jgi:2-dehydro-3-deoxyphosphooctonate aldolase (KDO 8-P synthase)